ncbi:MFS transporter [Sulfurimonas sp. NW15]|uniref:MFS transporter n=1 Tax=Sulfurimonas TaxID=202746 RepID=UPI00125F5572|nr:MFS transporter [Sulfurimonas hydrogeniphila]
MFKIAGVINYLAVVFLNAFTDLGHKIIIQNTIFKVYDGSTQIVLTAIVNALVLLPFILIFSPSGFLADRFAKNKIMEYAALFAVIITLGITYAYYHGYFVFAFILTFLLAMQSAIYGPAKYGYIKELVGVKFLSSANSAVQAITTVAILGGIIFYTVLFEGMYRDTLVTESQILQTVAPLGWLLVIGSIIEWFLASKLPNKMIEASKRDFRLKKYVSGVYLFRNIKTVRRNREIFDAIIALSLFWSISQVVLAVFGEYAKDELHVTNTIYVQGVMALAGIGIVVGSVMVAKLSRFYINVGLAGIGATIITLIVLSVPFLHSMTFIAIMFTLFGIFAAFILVPLNARIQYLASRVHLGIILAANNFIQNIFMFTFLLLTTVFAYLGMNAELLFYFMGMIGIYLVRNLYKRYVVEMFFSLMGLIAALRHKYIYIGLENIPEDKAVLLLGNHVSWLDWILLQLPIARRINYMMDKDIYNWKFFHAVFKKGEAIPLSPRAFKDAMKEAHKRLKKGSIVALFPEGEISQDGNIHEFKRGYELIPKDYEGVIVPFYIDKGIFGSSFAKYRPKGAKRNIFKRRVVKIYFGNPLPIDTKAKELRDIILQMREKYEAE